MPENPTTVWEIISPNQVVDLSLEDRSSLDAITRQLPGGFYSTFRTYGEGRRVIGLRAHLERLYAPACGLGLHPACPAPELRRLLDRLLETYRPGEARIRISLDAAGGRLFLAIQPLSLPSPEAYQRGVHVVTILNKSRVTPTLKKTDFIQESQPERAALARRSAYEGLLTQAGRILEGLTSNFFYIQDGTLGTAGRGVLRGVTRAEILRVARRELSLPVRYRALRLEEVSRIQEAFISSSSRGILPVAQVDETRIGDGCPGPITEQLMRVYQQAVSLRAEVI